MTLLKDFLRARAEGDVVGWDVEVEAAAKFGVTIAQVDKEIIVSGMMPSRYLGNAGGLSEDEQRALLGGKAAVVGCGGLGGYVVEALARVGVGSLVVIDPDAFEDHNMNRQLLATTETLGAHKAICAAERVKLINPAVSVEAHTLPFSSERSADLFRGVGVVIDALDTIPARLDLEDACERLSIPLIHAAVLGWHAQVTTILPGDRTLHALYGLAGGRQPSGGTLSFTPLVAAGIQTAEACRILTGNEPALRRKVLHIDLERMTMDLVAIEKGTA